ncbi:MAG: 3-deoxy-8-phosphooctulonate synthase [Planctomyces sp.]|nr:3-deoxy-8-phosphooctulonate synthase [Planctomyces sp.]MBA4039981.1 3-deoxy-8-phosphooctulonate synthase [Planctomyces sp.]MBA4119921.1 3-deoxy-8-phosphooctulonate synthase [Isosphaera sp.]
MSTQCQVGSVTVGRGRPLAVIAGPCVLETLELGLEVGRVVRDACAAAGLGYVFKASFDKANRSSVASPRGPGLERGLGWLGEIGRALGVPTTTDIHEPAQALPASRVVDALQIPAFLCRQTDLLLAAGRAAAQHGRAVNVKKGQFMSPGEMGGALRKLAEAGCTRVMLTERGTAFGYGRLVNDFLGLGDLMEVTATLGGQPVGPVPVCFDCTHSTQLPGAGEQTGGRPERAPLLARAAVAAGVHAVFLECHPEPARGLSDAATMLELAAVPGLVGALARIRGALVAGS